MRFAKYAGFGFAILATLSAAVLALKWREVQGFRNGLQAYLYAYPLVMTTETRADFLQHFLLNRFAHARHLPTHAFTQVVAPNVDTLYSIAFLDLIDEPLILRLPATGGRWVLMQVLDGWSNSIASAGTRLYGAEARDYALVGPDWRGELPSGMPVFRSNTNMNWIIGRTLVKGVSDEDAVQDLQRKYTLVPLSKYTPGEPAPPTADLTFTPQKAVPAAAKIAAMDGNAFFGTAARLMAHDAYPAPADGPLIRKLARVGLVPGQPFSMAALDPQTRQGVETAVWFAKCFFDRRAKGSQGAFDSSSCPAVAMRLLDTLVERSTNKKNNWTIPLNIGTYGTDYTLRAMVALLGFGANLPADAVYPSTSRDEDGQDLSGAHQYWIHFAPAAIPPANDFWSLTLYDSRGFLAGNALNRYALGNRSGLKTNADGSLDIWVQKDQPGDALMSNWLPAPPGAFKMTLRLYGPKPEVLRNEWAPPPVRRVR